MTKFAWIRFLVLLLIAFPSYSQKVKYKDIFALLSMKQYEQAEPFLRKYLKDNDDNPNAYLFMGITFQEKSFKTDVLKQTRLAIAYMDSSMIFYDKALQIMDEREVRKNKEYYISYNRRDLRTGEFGVKLSDIQFDLEKRKEFLKERIDKVKMVKHFFSLSDTLYKRSNALYRSIREKYATEKQLHLRADEKLISDLRALSGRYDSCVKAFDIYKSNNMSLGKTGYNQAFNVNDINHYEADGLELSDFLKEELKIWDYKKFAEKHRAIIEKEIFPMREHLISYDVAINKLRDKLNNDSVSVRSDLTKLIDKLLYEQLKKFDEDPLPMEVFGLKTADLEYRSVLVEHAPMRDSADVHLRIRLITEEMKALHKLDSISEKLFAEDIEAKSQDYEHFVTNTYSSAAVLKSYVATLKDYADRETLATANALKDVTSAMNWIIDGSDSIPLKVEMANRYKPMVVIPEKYTSGLRMIDTTSTEGYFYTITPTRKPEVKVIFPVDKINFRRKLLSTTREIAFSDASGQLFFVAVVGDQFVKDKHPVTLAKIYRSDGLAWSNNYQLAFVPTEISLKTETGEITLKNGTASAVIDKNGKLLK